MELNKLLHVQLEQAKVAMRSLQNLSDSGRQKVLIELAGLLMAEQSAILEANRLDMEALGPDDPHRDRLMLDTGRIHALIESLHDIAALPDPSGVSLLKTKTVEGLEIQKITVPLGVIGIIYESRPNVTVDVAALCIRSGNIAVLRGGSDAIHTNTCLAGLIKRALINKGLDAHCVQLLPPDRSLMEQFLHATRFIDVIIPRGSKQLIDYVRANSWIPVIETGAGVCHTYVEGTADLEQAVMIVVNAKVSRPSVCNSLDTILIDKSVAQKFLHLLAKVSAFKQVEIFADPLSYILLEVEGVQRLRHAAPEDFGREFLDYKCSVKVVEGYEEAAAHISMFSSRHSEAILTGDPVLQQRFLTETDAAAVYVNASTRFTDGAVFGLGAEIGISTQKLHARGPFALEKLVTEKWLVRGNGQIRS